ncbi:hypothetical protein QCA50_019869 [Cerrena zonata]|uniref:Uncharacterized protein n=1 Tax=Cerrena zonata TaxID=2478898 RepID=A0AAW0F8G4_9APHY
MSDMVHAHRDNERYLDRGVILELRRQLQLEDLSQYDRDRHHCSDRRSFSHHCSAVSFPTYLQSPHTVTQTHHGDNIITIIVCESEL